MEQELALKIVGGVIVVGGAIITYFLRVYGKKKELKIQHEDEDLKKIQEFNLNVKKAYDAVNNDADNEFNICQNVSKDYPREDGIIFQNKIKELEKIIQYADPCIDEMVKNTFNGILDDMAKYHSNLCLINVLDRQSKGYQNTNAPYGTQAYQAAATQNVKNIDSAANALMDCGNLKNHWRSLYQNIANKLN